MTQVYCVVIVNTILMYIHTGWWLQQLIEIKINYGLSWMFITEEFINFFFFALKLIRQREFFLYFISLSIDEFACCLFLF